MMRLLLIESFTFPFHFSPLRGVGAVVVGAGPAHAMYFSSYEFSKELLAKVSTNNHINYSRLPGRSQQPRKYYLKINSLPLPHCSMCRCCGHRHPRRHLESDGSDQAAPADVQLAIPVRVAVHEPRLQAGGPARLLPVLQHATGDEPALPGHSLLHIRIHPEPPEQGRQIQSARAYGGRWRGWGYSGGCNDAPGRRQDAAQHTGDGHWPDEGNVAGRSKGYIHLIVFSTLRLKF